jgi:preprotein translocase subunit YajC
MRYSLTSLIVMLNSAFLFAQTSGAAGQPGGGKSMLPTLLMMAVVFAIIYFLMILPQQKKQKETQNMLKNIKKGDKIVTIGGMLGTVGNVKDDTVMVKISDNNTVAEFRKSAIASVLGDPKPAESAEQPRIEKKA